jgi:Putative prokaryotic signal transducing protein
MKPVVIFKTFNQAEAQLVRSRLEAANFHPFIANENVAQYLGGFSNATTLRIEVPETEADEAKAFLAAPVE